MAVSSSVGKGCAVTIGPDVAARLVAPAKVTLALDVRPKADREAPWHAVDLVLVRIGLGDRLEVRGGVLPARPRVVVSGQGLTHDTLATHALSLVEQRLGRPLGVHVVLAKHVPAGAGMGGGSADAAAVLRWAAARWPELAPEVPAMAAAIGADVVFLTGPAARCRATGRGDQLDALPDTPRLWLAVAHPGFALGTAEVYRAFDRVGTTSPPAAPAVVDAFRRGMVPSLVGNQLEDAAMAVNPAVADFRARLERHAPHDRLTMTGSGSGFTAVAGDEREAAAIGRAWRAMGVPFVWWGEAAPGIGSHGVGGPA